ncbi:MAG: hypothetical protein ACI9UA_003516, partial [Pseudoalteromonas tetraodonis]
TSGAAGSGFFLQAPEPTTTHASNRLRTILRLLENFIGDDGLAHSRDPQALEPASDFAHRNLTLRLAVLECLLNPSENQIL